MSPTGEEGDILIITGVMMAAILAGIVWIMAYTRKLSKGAPSLPAARIDVSRTWLVPSTVATLAAVVFFLATLGDLPPGDIATHFDTSGTPNDWMSRTTYIVFSLGMLLGMWALLVGLFLGLTHFAFPGAETWPITGESVVKLLAVVFTGTQFLLGFIMLDTFWFAVNAEHVLPMEATVVTSVIVSLVAIPGAILWIALKGGRRQTSTSS